MAASISVTDLAYQLPFVWTDKLLRKITWLELHVDNVNPEQLRVHSCIGQTVTGRRIAVRLPFDTLSAGGYTNEIIQFARKDRVYARGLDIFRAIIIQKHKDEKHDVAEPVPPQQSM